MEGYLRSRNTYCICRRCGFTELYTKDAAEIPVDEIAGAEILAGDPLQPYR